MSRPDFSGRWRYDADASSLQISGPVAVVAVIEHRDSLFRMERSMQLEDRTDEFAIELTIGGKNAPLSRADATLHPAIDWDGDDLVFVTRIVRGTGEATNSVRYRLEEDGAVLVGEESFRSADHSYDNRWVMRRIDGD